MLTKLKKHKLVLIGGGGHCKVVISILEKIGTFEIVGISDRPEKLNTFILDIPINCTDTDLVRLFKNDDVPYALITLGSVGISQKRQELFNMTRRIGFYFPVIISPDAVVSEEVVIGSGTVVMPGAIVNSGSVIGSNCIINTGAIIEHDCRIGDYTHIAPGATLSGGVEVGDAAHIGAGATVIQSVSIGAKSIVGAGSVVIKSIPASMVVAGVPAAQIR